MKRPWWLFSIPKLYLVTGTPLLCGSLFVELDVLRLLCGLFAALTVLAVCMVVMQAWLAKRLYPEQPSASEIIRQMKGRAADSEGGTTRAAPPPSADRRMLQCLYDNWGRSQDNDLELWFKLRDHMQGVATPLPPAPPALSPEQTERGLDSLVDVLAERDLLQKLSNQQLVDECLKTDAADYEIVSIMLDRLDPGWEKRRTKTAGNKPPGHAYPFKPTNCPHLEHTFQCNGCGLDIRNARLMQPRNALDDEYLNGLAISFTEPVERIGCNYHFTKHGIIGLLHNLAATVEGMVRDESSHGAPTQNTKDVD